MKKIIRFISLSLVLIFCLTTSSSAIDQLTVLVEQDPYQVNEKGEPFGAAIDICKEMMKRVGLSDKMRVIPWARGYKMAQDGPNILLILGARTPEREYLFKWLGPIDRDAIAFYAKKGSGYKFKTLEDAKKIPMVGCVRGTIENQIFNANGFSNLDISDDIGIIIKKLMLNRVSVLPLGMITAKHIMATAGYSIDDVEQVGIVQDSKYYFIVSKDVPDPSLHMLQNALDEMKKDGSFNQFFVKNKQTVPEFAY
ncbi:MAG: transporter substrate-binding domain-containing protein [Chitinivibrionales bacterium]|nr:transporter substrate-binding domain-containing protein [Chitinivibrionales bacterium]